MCKNWNIQIDKQVCKKIVCENRFCKQQSSKNIFLDFYDLQKEYVYPGLHSLILLTLSYRIYQLTLKIYGATFKKKVCNLPEYQTTDLEHREMYVPSVRQRRGDKTSPN